MAELMSMRSAGLAVIPAAWAFSVAATTRGEGVAEAGFGGGEAGVAAGAEGAEAGASAHAAPARAKAAIAAMTIIRMFLAVMSASTG